MVVVAAEEAEVAVAAVEVVAAEAEGTRPRDAARI